MFMYESVTKKCVYHIYIYRMHQFVCYTSQLCTEYRKHGDLVVMFMLFFCKVRVMFFMVSNKPDY